MVITVTLYGKLTLPLQQGCFFALNGRSKKIGTQFGEAKSKLNFGTHFAAPVSPPATKEVFLSKHERKGKSRGKKG
jgi:hypothetical protein